MYAYKKFFLSTIRTNTSYTVVYLDTTWYINKARKLSCKSRSLLYGSNFERATCTDVILGLNNETTCTVEFAIFTSPSQPVRV